MIPRIQTGSSFKGAALYYFHDKRQPGDTGPQTSERVAWTYAVNTLEDDPEHVIREMQRTAFTQQHLKLASGNRGDGRPVRNTVMTVALSWSPDQTVSREQMIEAAHSFLKHMGWQHHQALFLQHTDTAHPHMHIILNRVHPETGMTLDDRWYKTRSQQWALGYERAHGKIYCERRVNRAKRPTALHPGQWHAGQKIASEARLTSEFRLSRQAREWRDLKRAQRHERQGYWKETGRLRKALRNAVRDEVRSEFAPEWKAYGAHRKTMEGRLRRSGEVAEPAVLAEWTQMRAAIARRQKERVDSMVTPAMKRLSEDRRLAYGEALAHQRDQRLQLKADQRAGISSRDLAAVPSPHVLTTAAYLSYARRTVEPARAASLPRVQFGAVSREAGPAQPPSQDNSRRMGLSPHGPSSNGGRARRRGGGSGRTETVLWRFTSSYKAIDAVGRGSGDPKASRDFAVDISISAFGEGRRSRRKAHSTASLKAAHGAARRAILREIQGSAAQSRVSALALLSAEYATKIADTERSAPRHEVAARLEALRNEQRAAASAITQRVAGDARQRRRAKLASLKDSQKEERLSAFRAAGTEVTLRHTDAPGRPRTRQRSRTRAPRPRLIQ